MTHWGWYWKVKRQHIPKTCCSSRNLAAIDSFKMLPRWLKNASQLPEKKVFEISFYDLKAYIPDDRNLVIGLPEGSYTISIEKKSAHFGGYYYFFRCPRCDKRSRKLYCFAGQYLCRTCGNLGYYTQRLRPERRFRLKRYKIEERIKNLGGDLSFGEKPSYMHKKTFKRLKDQAKYYDARSGKALFKELREWHGKQVEPYLDGFFEYEWDYTIKVYEESYGRS